MNWLHEPFFQQTLPVMVTFLVSIWLATWSQNKRSEEISKRIDDLAKGFDRSLGDLSKRTDQRLDDMSRRIDEMSKRFDQRFESVELRLTRIEDLLQGHEKRITSLEERSSPITRAR